MNTPNNGGPAFPHANPSYDGNWDDRRQIGGMSLRDYFAAKAMHGLLVQSRGSAYASDVKSGAEYAYAMADAMLEARGK